MAVLLFLFISSTVVFGVISPVIKDVKSVYRLEQSKRSLFVATGANEDIVYRLKNNMNIPVDVFLTLSGTVASTTVSDVLGGKEIITRAEGLSLYRSVKTTITLGSGASFNYGLQSGEGGVILENSSTVSGNIYSNGVVIGSGSNLIKGEVISASDTGHVEGVHATSSVYAHNIVDSTIDGDAYYQYISGSTVLGNLYPGSPDQATSTLPISDEKIEEWKADAVSGGVISSPCPYEINSATTIGPVKIACDLEIRGNNFTVVLLGNVWVEGDIKIRNSPEIKIDDFLEGKSVAIIADDPANRETGSSIVLENNVVFSGAPGNSYVLFVSQNESAENGGLGKAIEVQNSVTGDLLIYAGSGEIVLQNSVDLKEVTAYRIRLRNTSEVKYESGIANLLFTSGPGGGYEFETWYEIE